MGKVFGWLAALGLALGAAGSAGAASLPFVLAPPLRVEASPLVGALPAVSAPPPASFQLTRSGGTGIWGQQPEPATLLLLATGLGGLAVAGHREFV